MTEQVGQDVRKRQGGVSLKDIFQPEVFERCRGNTVDRPVEEEQMYLFLDTETGRGSPGSTRRRFQTAAIGRVVVQDSLELLTDAGV